jgi:V/A-type H+-transporting ATPase subunit A
VSPAGGNFEEPVTQSTLGTVKTFLGLSAERAYKRFYPAVDPLVSWSRYLGQLRTWYERNVDPGWTDRVEKVLNLLKRGDAVLQMMQVTGEEGITLEDFVTYHKALMIDMVYVQQDAFDEVDVSVPLERQKRIFDLLYELISRDYRFGSKDDVRGYFTRLTGLFKNLNYAREDSPDYSRYLDEIERLGGSVEWSPPARGEARS